ncbi:MAG: restriction endonuclease [Candidatus Omnitrophica bacterium]|nr:restriction endonuclease [Candidatus Omnitrophota bacterium]
MGFQKGKITSSRHLLPFRNLSDDDFERLCYWVVEKSSGFDSVQHYGMTGDKKRDVIGYKHNSSGKREKWYFQCKRYRKISYSVFKKELDAINEHCSKVPDFMPEVIVFVTACSVSPSCKDSVEQYAKRFFSGSIYFWTDVELDEKTKATGADKEFFNAGFDADEFADKVADRLAIISKPIFQQSGQLAGSETKKTDSINIEIDGIIKLIESNNIEDAKNALLILLGKMQDKAGEYPHELARIYNNLGVCFNRLKCEGGDFDKAEEYFDLALKVNPTFLKSLANKAAVSLNKGGKENFKKAYDIMLSLWNNSDKKEPLYFQTLIWSIFHYQGPKNVFEFYSRSPDAKCLIEKDWGSANLMGVICLAVQDFKTAEEFVKIAIDLSPNSPQNLSLKARILMGRSQQENIIPSVFEIVPKFRDYKDIEEALALLEQALETSKIEHNHYFEEQVKTDILICWIWLRRANEARYRDLRLSIDMAKLEPFQQRQLQVHDFIVELQARNFEAAYSMLIQTSGWRDAGYREKIRLAHIFLLRGAPQQSKDILMQIETEANKDKNVRFWLEMSMVEVLLDNKNLAIIAAQKAKDYAKDTDEEKTTLSHFNALMLRYASSGESDRLVEGMFDYVKRYPEEKAVVAIKAVDDDGKLTDEIKSMLLHQKERYENVRKTFRTQPLISYFLEEIFKRPYAEILSFQNDPEFIIEFTIPSGSFTQELTENLEKARGIIFDYPSLLNLSKMNLLGHLSKFDKKLYIAESLFYKIQNELLVFENEDLRRLWNFLRTSKEINLVEDDDIEIVDSQLSKLFEKWVIDSIKVAKEKLLLFVVDDLRFLIFLRSQLINGTNSLILLKSMLSNGWIDAKIYSTSIGDLAERFYTFLSFTGDDLFQIAMEDKAKITLRSYHLVNQLFLPGSIAPSFTGAFLRFIDLLWKTGSLPKDKVEWLVFLTQRILDLIDRQGGIKDREELKKIAPDFVQIWITAIKGSNKDEIEIIDKRIDEVLNKPNLTIFKENIKGLILAKKNSFKSMN